MGKWIPELKMEALKSDSFSVQLLFVTKKSVCPSTGQKRRVTAELPACRFCRGLTYIFFRTMAAPDAAAPTSPERSVQPSASTEGSDGSSATLSPEFVAVILAATAGTRLYPLTSEGDDDHDDEFDALPMDQEDEEEEEEEGDGSGNDDNLASDAPAVDSPPGGEAAKDGDDDDVIVPKHLLPLAGSSILRRLLGSVASAGFVKCVVAVSASDNALTAESLLSECGGISRISDTVLRLDGGNTAAGSSHSGGKSKSSKSSAVGGKSMEISIFTLNPNCGGSADAIRHLSTAGAVPISSHLVVMPGDLVLGSSLGNSLRLLADAHRRGQEPPMEWQTTGEGGAVAGAAGQPAFSPPACTVLLSDVGDEDENGAPLKESAKAKKGGLSRDEEDIEFIGLSSPPMAPSPHQPSSPRRLMIKQSKVAVEEDEGTGSTPKLVLPKGRFRHPGGPVSTAIRTDLHDLHVYALSPWVVRLLSVRSGLSSLQKEVLPLLISRQFRGVAAAFGSAALEGSSDEGREALDSVLASSPFALGGAIHGRESITAAGDDGDQDGGGDGQRGSLPVSPPFAVSAQVLDRKTSRLTLRCATIPAYLYGCREIVVDAAKAGAEVHKAIFPEGTQVNSKFQSILLPTSTVGEKVTLKSSTVGKGSRLGSRCRLNNVVIMDGVSVGDNCILQNSVLGTGCVIRENCNLNDCQVAPGAEVPSLTKEKGESFMR